MRNKIISIFAFLLLVAGVINADATTAIVGGTSQAIGTTNFTPSTKVRISVTAVAASYGAASIHESGTLAYATGGGTGYAGDPSKILQATCSANPCGTTPPTSSATAVATGAITGSFQ